ncbi:lactonase family protein [Pseudozobellia thermophila]|uniref:6-phosphogluconolactonase n=1 Tax=Pseudozobellia thermophila TaxID=192903 RepID=A0A1M6GEH0_9FLAO|nr:lactonase family protein [Pseudozobellia thermophila]SHJ08271.1 6-phosphogluconolactonase [Pseudozobellia thermophila]
MEILVFFIGSYTEYPIPGFGGIGHGIYTVQLDTGTGALRVLFSEPARNPSYLALSGDNRYLYTSTELDEKEGPKVRAYRVRNDYSLEFINERPIVGGYPCHIATQGNSVLLACYASGNVFQYRTGASGQLMPKPNRYDHEGFSVDKGRQEGPHAHQVAVHPNKRDVYVCDLGIDRIKAYRFEGDELVPNPAKDCDISKGNGPRHMVFDREGKYAFVIGELSGTISVLQSNKGVFKELGTYDTLPEGYDGNPSASAIRLHPDGRYLYVANRKLEAISLFKVDKGSLQSMGHTYTGGEELREFNITPDGQWLIACHQNSHDTVVYRIGQDGRLHEKYRTQEILSPVCVVF